MAAIVVFLFPVQDRPMSTHNKASSAREHEHERRGVPRHAANPDTVCRVLLAEGTRPEPAELHNVSTHGLHMVLKERHDVGTPLVVQITHKEGTLDRRVMVRVVRVHEGANGHFAMGCAFVTPLEGHEILALVM
jgi:hypothetical protein